MKKPLIIYSIITALLAAIPYMASFIINSHAVLGIIVILWLIVNPIYFAIMGISFAKFSKTKAIWFMPIVFSTVIYIANAVVTSFDIWAYFVGDILITYILMAITIFIKNLKEKTPEGYLKAKKIAVITLISVVVIFTVSLISMFAINLMNPSNFDTTTVMVIKETKGTSIDKLLKNRTKYIGDNSSVGNIINELSFPGTVKYDKFELQTKEKPYCLTVYFTTDSGPLKFYKEDIAWSEFYENQIILFTLIGNLEEVRYNLRNENEYIEMVYNRQTAEVEYGDLFSKTETDETFRKLLDDVFENNGGK